MADRTPIDRLVENRFLVLGVGLWAVSVVVAVLLGDPPAVAAGYLFLPAVLVAWGAYVLADGVGVSTRAVGGLLLLVGGLGEYGLYFWRGPNADLLGLTGVWLLGLLLVVVAERRG
ncbi:hypothetical protein [Haloarchaeobius salinus]|uniref:hypothetical protein n=1 Tax=Haloarchaeobius salinus TaxID=1198298 RepID=UPI00210DBE02|nr:hypothetical protein [Haloarchaeobius salinus]